MARRAEQWDQGFAHLGMFVERTGHAWVPVKFKTEGYSLGQWVDTQRKTRDRLTGPGLAAACLTSLTSN